MGWKPGQSSKFRPILATQKPLTAFHRIKQKKIFFETKFQNGRLKKNFVSQNPQFSIFFCEIERDWSLGQ